MEKSCEHFEQMLVDYADGQLSPIDLNKVAEHLVKCSNCRKLHNALQKSLELTDVIWADSFAEAEHIRLPARRKTKGLRPPRYAAVAASVLLVLMASVLWLALNRPEKPEVTFAEIERSIAESATAARLLAATELLAECPDAQPIVDQQYRYIVEAYPGTTAANKARLKAQ